MNDKIINFFSPLRPLSFSFIHSDQYPFYNWQLSPLFGSHGAASGERERNVGDEVLFKYRFESADIGYFQKINVYNRSQKKCESSTVAMETGCARPLRYVLRGQSVWFCE